LPISGKIIVSLIEKVGGHGLAGLDLDRQGGAVPLDHHIDFFPLESRQK
jgi:hypothetical protein